MLAWITYLPRGLPRVHHHIELLQGLPLCRVEVGGRPSGLLRLLLRREGRVLHQAGVREGTWPEDLPSWAKMGLHPVDIMPLRRALLPALLDQAFRQKRLSPRSASVRLTAEGTSLPVYWAAQLLAERVRYLHLQVGCGQQALEDWLLQRYGLACGGADAALEVTFRADAPESALLLGESCPGQGVEYILPPALQDAMPGGVEGERLLAALYRQGRLRAGDLSVRRIYFGA